MCLSMQIIFNHNILSPYDYLVVILVCMYMYVMSYRIHFIIQVVFYIHKGILSNVLEPLITNIKQMLTTWCFYHKSFTQYSPPMLQLFGEVLGPLVFKPLHMKNLVNCVTVLVPISNMPNSVRVLYMFNNIFIVLIIFYTIVQSTRVEMIFQSLCECWFNCNISLIRVFSQIILSESLRSNFKLKKTIFRYILFILNY